MSGPRIFDGPEIINYSRLKQAFSAPVLINQANTDIWQFTSMPAKWRLRLFTAFDATGTPILGSVGLYTAAAAGGTNLVAPATLTALTAPTKFTDMTLAVTADYQTSSSVFLRNVTANAAAVSVTFVIEFEDLTNS